MGTPALVSERNWVETAIRQMDAHLYVYQLLSVIKLFFMCHDLFTSQSIQNSGSDGSLPFRDSTTLVP